MLSESERDAVRAGNLAEQMKQSPWWPVFLASLDAQKEIWLRDALRKGETDFEKGAVYAFDLVRAAPDATIERRDELLARERALSATEDEGGDADGLRPAAMEKEQVP